METITVTTTRPAGMTLREYASDFVLEIADPPGSSFGYARWGRRVCVSVIDAPVENAQFVADRISAVASDLGLSAGEPDCTPDLTIMFAPDGAALASALVEASPLLFRPFGGEGGTTQGVGALNEFATSDAAVRWWQITMPVDNMGRPAIRTASAPTASTLTSVPWVAGGNSLIRDLTEDDIWRSYVIVDTRKIVGLDWGQLADYLAMVSLAQIDPKGSAAGYDSILNLFAAPSSVRGLTEWDEAYLRAIYRLDRRLLPRNQRGALASLIAREQRRIENE